MITSLRAYSNVPQPVQNLEVLTMTETVTRSVQGGATGDEFMNTRLANFLSDDVAKPDRDLDIQMRVPDAPYRGMGEIGGEASSTAPAETRSEPGVMTPEPTPLSFASMEQVLQNQMMAIEEQQSSSGFSAGAAALQAYTSTQDVLSRAIS